MSNQVTASIEIDAPRETVFDFMLDPKTLDDWVTIHKKVNSADTGEAHEGFCMEQTLCLRKVSFKVKWTLTECERPERATWEGNGPAYSHARTAYVVTDLGGGRTRLDYENEFKAPGRHRGR